MTQISFTFAKDYDVSKYSPFKTVWRTLITFCYKEFIDSLTK